MNQVAAPRTSGAGRNWPARLLLVALVPLAALVAWFPTGFRLDVAVLAVAASFGVVPGVIAVVAGAIAVAIRSHDAWRAATPFLIAVIAAPGLAVLGRRPARSQALPSRTAARLLIVLAGAIVLGWLEHVIEFGGLHSHQGHVAWTALHLLCGALLGLAFMWRPRRNRDASTVFLTAVASLVTVALVLITLSFWSRQDEQLLHVTVDATQQGFLFSLADQMNVITNKAGTSPLEPFTAERFPVLMQPLISEITSRVSILNRIMRVRGSSTLYTQDQHVA